MKPIAALSFAALFLISASSALATELNPAEAEQAARDTIEQVRKTVAQEKGKMSPEMLDKKLHDMLLPIFDFDAMARSSLGANWRKITPEQQQEFVKNFSTLLSETYLTKIRKNIETSKVNFLPPVAKEDRVVVRSKVESRGDQASVDYRMYKQNGRWRVYDVVIENVGLVSNYRSEFTSTIEREGFEAMLKKLQAKTAALKSKREQ